MVGQYMAIMDDRWNLIGRDAHICLLREVADDRNFSMDGD